MEGNACPNWHPLLLDPSGERTSKPRQTGKTMIIDKGLGLHAFEDLLQTVGEYIDIVKLGFGTSPLYPTEVLRQKAEMAKTYNICFIPGGTFLEIAVQQDIVPSFFHMVKQLGFTGVEVSDGSISLSRRQRSDLIVRGREEGFVVFSEYGKKLSGSGIDMEALIETVYEDREHGSEFLTIEGRESGIDVGIYDKQGECVQESFRNIVSQIPHMDWIMWEAPLKSQQLFMLKELGSNVNLGNIAPQDVMTLEALRRGLRSDTFVTKLQVYDYVI